MSTHDGPAFTRWLRTQLQAKGISQRLLAHRSGVDHSTISRMVHGDRVPTLRTATRLASGLRVLGADDGAPDYLGLITGPDDDPAARVARALRADDMLTEAQVREVLDYYEALRSRRLAIRR